MQQSVSKLVAPLSGPVLSLDDVPDPVFAQRLVGQGIAIDPTSQVLVSPLSGKIVQLHRARHAVTVVGDDGLEILMHIGLDTVKLGGEGFRPKVQVGDRVRAGQALIEFDADLIARRAKSLITIIIVTDVDAESLRTTPKHRVQAGKDILLEVLRTGSAEAAATAAGASAESSDVVVSLHTGLHARPTALLVGQAKAYDCKITIIKDGGRTANAKSVVGIMSLEVGHGDVVRFRAEGTGAERAVNELARFLSELEEAPPDHPPAEASATAAAPKRTSTDANVMHGVGVSPGLAIGRIHQILTVALNVRERAEGSPEDEAKRLDQALRDAKTALEALQKQVTAQTGANRAAIFAAHQELLEDPDIVTLAHEQIARRKSAAFAWDQAIGAHADRLSKLNNELMANRANDLRDVGRRVLRLLVTGGETQAGAVPPNSILIAENLTPSETVQLDREKVLGFCTTTGGATSHVAILARSLGLPAIAGIDERVLELADGAEVILDGDHGELRLSPSDEAKAHARKLQERATERREAALGLASEPAATRDGHRVEVAANIGSVADARKAVEMGADGVGLLRSEFLFLERETAPSEEEQFKVYQEIADVLGERPLVIRTLDVGGDKPLKYLPIEAEENPFLGIRGIRVGFIHPEILRQQLRAILRVRTKGKLCVMFPMISTIEEFRQAKAILEEERLALNAPVCEVGIMVEVPSVALIAEVFAREVDFFSVGTNDLTQYTMAMDRGHKGLAKQVDALHPAVLAMIELSVKAAHTYGKWVGVCGGLASDLKAVPILLGLGVDELSVSIPTIPLVKAEVREVTITAARDLASRAVRADTAAKVRELNP